jgi:NADH-quinone oxidoreductase subunit C
MTQDAGSTSAVAGATPSDAPSRASQLAALLEQALPGQLKRVANHTGELSYEVRAADLLRVASALRDGTGLQFEMCMDVCGVDYLEHGRAEWKTEQATVSGFSRGVARVEAPDAADRLEGGAVGDGALPGRRFAVVYHLQSIALNQRLRLKVFCPDDTQPMVDSVYGIWASANWFEREAFDLFGILFMGHPDLRRLLTDYGFIGHPFRKDFPLSGHVEVRYDPEKGRVVYQPVSIEPRVLVPKVIRHDNRYDAALTNASVAAPSGKSDG